MATRIAINGFGRIGRQVLKAIIERQPNTLEVVAINDLADPVTNAHLLKYDSNYRRFPGSVEAMADNLVVNGNTIRVFAERDPAKIPWGQVDAQVVVESTGLFTDADRAREHLRDSVKKVIISAPSKGEDMMIVLGVNEQLYDPNAHAVLSNASCTTNCVAPMVKVLHENFGVQKALMSTIHSYTNDQSILDTYHKDLRRARSAATNIIPTTTGAAQAVGTVIPALQGRIHGLAYRVPVPTGSIIDLTAILEREATSQEINEAFLRAAGSDLSGILEYCTEELVSSDFIENSHSCIFDALTTMVIGGNLVKIAGWYDNEWGYSCRTADLCAYVGRKGV